MNGKETVLLTGASGFIGGALARRLAGAGYRVICPVRPHSPNRGKLNGVEGIDVITVAAFDLESLTASLGGLSAEIVFNLASYGVRQSDRDPGMMIEGNVSLLLALIQATSAWPLRVFVHAGSCSEYAAPHEEKLIREDYPLRPGSLYGAAKAASFLLGNALAADLGVPMTTLRLFGVYGDGESPERLLPYLINKLKNNMEAHLTGGRQVRDLLYIDDVTAAFMTVLDGADFRQGQAYNVCSGSAMSVEEVAVSVARLMNRPRRLLKMGTRDYRKGEPMWLAGDNSLFRSATGWSPGIDIEEGVTRMLAALNGGN